ncbi:AtuA-related protein [Arthrobacter sp. YN]|uniref:AtuA-related protein n=1 Tax=Arthrobacter sp. YN TaxID=2020486 RepID=UPI000B5DCDBD|nr:hypothetical protein [Arthrobacter sp. YN]ASN19972.1 hypothetical protein CGK93_10000 [Arthrobacter sp. YN]
MTTQIMLADVAHARAGDKGDTSILVVAPLNPTDYQRLQKALTKELVAAHFGTANYDDVRITPVAHLAAVVIAVANRLAGGVTRSPTTDPHGKTLSSHLLGLMVPWPHYADGDAN